MRVLINAALHVLQCAQRPFDLHERIAAFVPTIVAERPVVAQMGKPGEDGEVVEFPRIERLDRRNLEEAQRAAAAAREIGAAYPRNHFLLMPQIVAATRSVAFLPSRLLPDDKLTILEMENNMAPPGFELIAAWHPGSTDSQLLNWLVQMLASNL